MFRLAAASGVLLTALFACDLTPVDPPTVDVLLRVDSVGLSGRWADSALIRLHYRVNPCEEFVRLNSTPSVSEFRLEAHGRRHEAPCAAAAPTGTVLHAIRIPATSELRVAVRQPDGSPDMRFVDAGTGDPPPPPRCGDIARITGMGEVIAGRSYALGFIDPCAHGPYSLLRWSVADTTIARVTASSDSTAVLTALRSGQTRLVVEGVVNGTVIMRLDSPLLVRAP